MTEDRYPPDFYVHLDLTRRFVAAWRAGEKERADTILEAIKVLEREYPETKAILDRRYPIARLATDGA